MKETHSQQQCFSKSFCSPCACFVFHGSSKLQQHQASLSFTIFWSLLRLMSIESVMPSNRLILCRPSSPAFNLSQHQGLFQWVRSSNQVVKVLELQLQICPFNEYSRLISFRINCFDLLAVQGTLKSLLQHYSSKASILRCSAFFMVQLSHPHMTIGNTIALTIWTKWWQSDVSAF